MFDTTHNLFPPTPWELNAAASVGFSITMFRFVIAFLVSVPVSIGLRYVPSVLGRHMYSIVTGFALIYYPFGSGCFHSLVTATVVYAFMVLVPDSCGMLTWMFAFPYLIGNHIHQASGMSWKEGNLDFTGAQMVLTLKLVAVAMCRQDGRRKRQQLHPYGESKKVESLPSVFEYYSYLFSAGSLLSGPFFEAKDYFDYVERRGDWEGEIPSPLIPGLYRFGKALCCAAVWMYFTNRGLNVDFIESEYWRHELPLVVRLASLWATLVVYRFKYYAVWTVSESCMVFSGLGYRKTDENGRARWDRYITSHIRQVELNPSLADTPRHWNICTGLWLRHYVYERLSKPGDRPSFFNMMVTQLVSGVWHGVFAGYWLFFATSAFMFQASRLLYKYELHWDSKWRNFLPWYWTKIVMTALVLDYAGSAFMVLSFHESLLIWRSTYYIGHVWIAVMLLLGIVMPPKKLEKKNKGE